MSSQCAVILNVSDPYGHEVKDLFQGMPFNEILRFAQNDKTLPLRFVAGGAIGRKAIIRLLATLRVNAGP
jgi:hypothetical protein